MTRKNITGFILIILAFFCFKAKGQVSQGGIPMDVPVLKSAESFTVEMPSFEKGMQAENEVQPEQAGKLKPFRFAHAFDVNFSVSNSGKWFDAGNGYAVWKLKIKSAGAYSLNLIFSGFKLPEGARLFLYNENRVLGAFTAFNNKSSGKFAVAPIEGDEITVQYEVPEEFKHEKHFTISQVNHDFVGILKSDRRPLGKVAGECNVDVNCSAGEEWKEVKNSVVRIIVNGVEVCTGTLVNNTAEDEKPYVLSAAHCYDKWDYAQTSVYVFNYESPFCAPLDGDPLHSVSGAIMKAQFDSLDFALAELSLVPPPEYRPYYAGWNHGSELPASSVSIHHPQGDIKKIAFDNDPPVIARFGSPYTKDGFLKILRWDAGVTEAGSSGGPLFNRDKQLIGTLTGGEAVCKNPVNDYYARFALSWDYRSDSTKQLKHWLDPLKKGVSRLDGIQFNTGENLCGAFTNLTDNDSYDNITIINSGSFSGYWGGSNNAGITEIMERFSIPGNEQLAGISIGVGKLRTVGINNTSEIKIKVYNGNSKPEALIYEQPVRIKNLYTGTMNFIGFNDVVEPADTFFVGFELSNVQSPDSFVVYQSLRKAYDDNAFYLKQNGTWYKFNDANPNGKSMVNVFELVACNIDDFSSDTPKVSNPRELLVYPNPAQSVLTLEAGQDFTENELAVYNLIGQQVGFKFFQLSSRKATIDLSGNIPGVYFIRLNSGADAITRKVSFVPW